MTSSCSGIPTRSSCRDPTGYEVKFKKNPQGEFVGRDVGFDATITIVPGGTGPATYKMVDHKTQTKWFFNAAGRLSKQEDRNGRAITYQYLADDMRVNTITDSKGRRTVEYAPTTAGGSRRSWTRPAASTSTATPTSSAGSC